MNRFRPADFLFGAFLSGFPRWLVLSICIGTIVLLATIRKETDADLAFASMALLPVLVTAWIGGKRYGLFMAVAAAAVLGASGIASGREYSAAWIPWANAVLRLLTYGLVALLVAQVRLQFERTHRQATQDVLTGLRNRRSFLDAGAHEVERAQRYGHPLAVAFLDLDDFKQLNDTLGHEAGDSALRAVADALRGSLRSSDLVARLGGDEFAALLPEIGYAAAVEAGRKISAAVNRALGDFPSVSASMGVAWFAAGDREFSEMLKAADTLMYEVKGNGKAAMRSRCFNPEPRPLQKP